MAAPELKSDALLELMKKHLSTDAGKELTKKIGLVYQINIAPKVVRMSTGLGCLTRCCKSPVSDLKIGFSPTFPFVLQKIGFDEVVYIVDLKKGEVTKGPCFPYFPLFHDCFCAWFLAAFAVRFCLLRWARLEQNLLDWGFDISGCCHFTVYLFQLSSLVLCEFRFAWDVVLVFPLNAALSLFFQQFVCVCNHNYWLQNRLLYWFFCCEISHFRFKRAFLL